MNFNWVDVSISIILAVTTVRGFLRGFIRLIFDIMAIILAIFLALQWYRDFSIYIANFVKMPNNISLLVSFVLIWVVTYLCVVLIGNLVHKLIGEDVFSPVNFIGGGMIGLLKGLLIIWMLLQLVLIAPLPEPAARPFKNSQGLKFIQPILQSLQVIFKTEPRGVPSLTNFFRFGKIKHSAKDGDI
jgi:membrane protein required for colicin V production